MCTSFYKLSKRESKWPLQVVSWWCPKPLLFFFNHETPCQTSLFRSKLDAILEMILFLHLSSWCHCSFFFLINCVSFFYIGNNFTESANVVTWHNSAWDFDLKTSRIWRRLEEKAGDISLHICREEHWLNWHWGWGYCYNLKNKGLVVSSHIQSNGNGYLCMRQNAWVGI